MSWAARHGKNRFALAKLLLFIQQNDRVYIENNG
jgi:hypothetical protein